ncbi:MAG: GDSL-type esterase/lipase family protein [Candidatus Nanohaloarchaea archaeon]|nr:GDSL-type esterase/lipase family protein [Candidatus Nanohaloarchaea archaeon]
MTNVVVFGDSVAVGCWDRQGGWVDRVRSELYSRVVDDDVPSYESGNYAEVYNLSVSGETAVGTLERFEDELPPRVSEDRETVVVLAVGANDAYREDGELNTPPERFRETMQELVAAAQGWTDRVLLVGPPAVDEDRVDPVPWHPTISYFEEDRDRYAAIIAEVADVNDLPHVSPFDGIDEAEKEVLLDDGVHPSTEGHARLAESVLDVLDDRGWG